MAFIVTIRRFSAGAPASEMSSAVDPFAERELARQHVDALWMEELARAQAELAEARSRGVRGLSAIPTELNADMKAVTLHAEDAGVLRSTIICVERAS